MSNVTFKKNRPKLLKNYQQTKKILVHRNCIFFFFFELNIGISACATSNENTYSRLNSTHVILADPYRKLQ